MSRPFCHRVSGLSSMAASRACQPVQPGFGRLWQKGHAAPRVDRL